MKRDTPLRSGCAIGALAALVILAGICAFFRISGPGDFRAFCGMLIEAPSVWQDFAWRRYHPGDSAEDLTRRRQPGATTRFGRYEIYDYFPGDLPLGENQLPFAGLTVIARDGKLMTAKAWSCTWRFTFFDTPRSQV